MSRIKDSEFLKKYASSMKNLSGQATWSGRGIGIPAMGAVDGSGDGSNLLGRPPRPTNGGTSQYADSGFSTALSRVNKGWEDIDVEFIMFPEQDDDIEDIYYYDNPVPVVSRKLPKNYTAKNEAYLGWLEDDFIVDAPAHSLTSESMVWDIGKAIGNFGYEVVADTGRSLTSLVTGDTVGAVFWGARNIAQIDNDMEKSNRALDAHRANPSPETREMMASALDDLTTNLGDLAGVVLDAIDSASPIGNIAGWVGSLIQSARKLFTKVRNILRQGKTHGKIKRSFFMSTYEFLIKTFGDWFKSGENVPSDQEQQTLMDAPDMVLTLAQEIENYDMGIEASEELAANAPLDLPPATPIRTQQSTSYGAGLSGPALRTVFYEDYRMKKGREQVQPEGYQERDVPMSDELQRIFDEEILQGFDEDYDEDSSVNYSTDGGVVSYQARSLEETALLRFIRSVIQEDGGYRKDYLSKTHRRGKGEESDPELDFVKEIDSGPFSISELEEVKDEWHLDEDDERGEDVDHKDVDEASVAADGGGGPATPLGTGPDGRADSGPAARKRAIDAAEKSFGGASQLNESRWARLAGIK